MGRNESLYLNMTGSHCRTWSRAKSGQFSASRSPLDVEWSIAPRRARVGEPGLVRWPLEACWEMMVAGAKAVKRLEGNILDRFHLEMGFLKIELGTRQWRKGKPNFTQEMCYVWGAFMSSSWSWLVGSWFRVWRSGEIFLSGLMCFLGCTSIQVFGLQLVRLHRDL